MVAAGRDCGDVAETADRDRQQRVDRGAVAELALGVAPPPEHAAVVAERERVGLPGGDSDGVSDRVEPQRDERVGPGTVAELAAVVASPAPHPAVGHAGERVVAAGRKLDRQATLAGERDRRRFDGVHVDRVVADFAGVVVAAPGPDAPVFAHRQRV